MQLLTKVLIRLLLRSWYCNKIPISTNIFFKYRPYKPSADIHMLDPCQARRHNNQVRLNKLGLQRIQTLNCDKFPYVPWELTDSSLNGSSKEKLDLKIEGEERYLKSA